MGEESRAPKIILGVSWMTPEKVGSALSELYYKKTGIRPFLLGQRGMGKTSVYGLVRDKLAQKLLKAGKIKDESDVELRFIYTAQMADGGDLLGLPDKSEGITTFARNELFPTDADVELGRAKPYGILVFDEPNRGTRETIQALFQILVSGELGPHKLASGWEIGLAGNPETGDYIVNTMDEAFWDRVMLIAFENTSSDWVRYAKNKQLNSNLVGFVEMHGSDQLRKAMGIEDVKLPVKPSYRSLEQAARMLDVCEFESKDIEEECLRGLLGTETTIAFTAYLKDHERRPLTANDVFKNWKKNKAVWEKIMEDGAADLRVASVENVVQAIEAEDATEGPLPWGSEWSAEAAFEFFSMLPQDHVLAVLDQLVTAAQGNGKGVARYFIANVNSPGKRLAKLAIPSVGKGN